MISYCRRVGNWFSKPLIQHLDSDRPFRLRRISAAMLLIGWVVFALACVMRSIPEQCIGATLFIAGLLSVHWFDRRDDKKPSIRRGL